MKKRLTAALSALLATLILAVLPAVGTVWADTVSLDTVSAEAASDASDVTTPPLFFDQSEADVVPGGYDSQPSPVVWIFVVGGVAALAAVGVLVWVNRRQDH